MCSIQTDFLGGTRSKVRLVDLGLIVGILTDVDILALMSKASSRQNVYIMCDDAYMYATDPNTGDVHWRKYRTSFSSGAFANVYCRAT